MPMSDQARTGLIAGAVVAGLFLCAGAGGGFLMWNWGQAERDRDAAEAERGRQVGLGDEEAARRGKRLADRPISEGNNQDDEAYVLGHRWWKSKPTRADLDRLVRLVIETPSSSRVYVAQDFDMGAVPNYLPSVPESFAVKKKSGVGVDIKPHFTIEAPGDKRPARQDVLRILRGQLDRAEYRDSPGR